MCRALVTFSHVFTTVSGVVEVLERVDSLKVCPGNADEKFSSLRSFRKGMFSAGIPYCLAPSPHSSHQCCHSTGETRTATVEHNTLGHSTIRHSRCELLLENSCSSTRCPKCEAHRKSLHAMLSRKKKESSSDQAKPSSHSNFRYLATPVKVNRLAQTHTLLRQKTQYIERLKLKIEKLQGVTMDSSTHDDLQAIVKENTTLIHVSGKAYEILRQSGCIKLPSQRTLRDYTHFVSTTVGFSTEVDRQLMDIANIEHCKEHEKYVLLQY